MSKTGAEVSRLINVEGLGRDPIKINIQATKDECKSLADGLGIIGLSGVMMSGVLRRQQKTDKIEVSAALKAHAVQACVATLEPVSQTIDVEFMVYYTFDKEDVVSDEVDYVIGMDEEDLPELIVNGQIDMMDIVAEQIALALDPYPRAENIAPVNMAENAGETEIAQEVHRPFANLKDLMNKK
ncbi:DUF177 domain-containing protein [Sneathiella marina]|uniref:DUF177 domain-containing protein n=1 Tax=Sneathiella marina TaxID=2950108 RepID=A0ABY4VYQ8_9PROT|nr:DUF177 domain-containing protein [Sneathiella marina]USG60065.1 DUF177 domain-containing protein [Sneathiella marina]